jgi:hypothetical protein
VKNAAMQAYNDVKQVGQTFIDYSQSKANSAMGWLNDRGRDFGRVWNGVKNGVKNFAKNVAKNVGRAVKNGLTNLGRAIQNTSVYKHVKDWAKQTWNYVKKKHPKVADALRKAREVVERKVREAARKVREQKLTEKTLKLIEKTAKTVALVVTAPIKTSLWLHGQLAKGVAKVVVGVVQDQVKVAKDLYEVLAKGAELQAQQVEEGFTARPAETDGSGVAGGGGCENWFDCAWEGNWEIGSYIPGSPMGFAKHVVGPLKGNNGAPDYITIDAGLSTGGRLQADTVGQMSRPHLAALFQQA